MKFRILKQLAIVAVALTAVSGGLALVPAASASAAEQGCITREFQNGVMNDKCVGYIQAMVNKVNGAKLSVDNDYGPKTQEAVRAVQKRIHSKYKEVHVDGITGRQTWIILCTEWARYKAVANAAGCQSFPKDVISFVKTSGSMFKDTKKVTVTNTSATKKKTTKATRACTEQTFSRSSSKRNSVCVSYIHNMLNLATNSQLDTTEPYNGATRTAIKAFQTNRGVKGDSRGAVGKNTWAALCSNHAANGDHQSTYNDLKDKAGCK